MKFSLFSSLPLYLDTVCASFAPRAAGFVHHALRFAPLRDAALHPGLPRSGER